MTVIDRTQGFLMTCPQSQKKVLITNNNKNKVNEMKKKKLTSLDILNGTVGGSAALNCAEMKEVIAGSDCLPGCAADCQPSWWCASGCQ